MKNIRMISFVVCALILFSCDDTIMEWEVVDEDNEVAQAELPLDLDEKISRYDALKTYTDNILGVGIIMDLYVNNVEYRNLVNENYDDVTVGYAMKHGPMVNAQGEINFESVDNFVALTNEAGIDIYGHTLVWHANQNASYLNGLIASTVIPGSSGSNSLDLSGLKDGTLNGWGAFNAGAGISIINDNGLSGNSQAVRLISGTASAQPYELQLITPDIPVVMGHTYEVSFYIKSEQAGQGRISFSGLENNYPYQDWYNTGGEFTESFSTTSQWQQVKFTVSDFTDTSFGMAFDLGYLPNVTYYLDVDNISVVDLDAEPSFVNLITNGDFENGTLDGWDGYGNNSTREVTVEGAGFGDTGYAMVLTNPTEAQSYEAQQVFTFDQPLEMGTEYTCSFWVKASSPATLQFELQSEDYSGDYYGGIAVGTDWVQISQTVTPTTDGRIRFIFDFGESATTYTIDDIVFTSGEVTGGSEPTIIEKSDEEKTAIIGEAMENWIAGMVSHYKEDVFAWDVVNEPMKEGGSLRDGNVTELANDDFYWVKYLGPDYAVTAFNLARQYGNPTDILFINDYNLEASLAKCDGIIEYTQYIESQGATVDGIGTQMHISLDTNRENIIEMFKKLAASGKLIKISELDVRLGTASPTLEQLIQQAEMYKFVIDSFKEFVPTEQQYGITLWNLSDKENEHEFWLPDESPNVFDANFGRKPAYKGVADGLAGRDVSEGFSGEIQN
ncbi:endo-1,4-beta-xylanase [Maribacter confluentis]|uniref:endo-1,4-beta-xylanase n=1 Tax=Maribacter confluentis TaxID=1656093 RepID=A0ABT8RM40_9FLAO|nr:endo-1,4-beta-xylanase [Maribacter confluentis]MDO1511648.1 endo-1,4-beta-xylanase [Maribacter confluentis]